MARTLKGKPLVFQATEVQWGASDRNLLIRVMHGVTGERLDHPHSGEIYVELQDDKGRCIDEKTISYRATPDRVTARVLRERTP